MAMRVSGINSGLDTDSIVQELVSAYNTKTEKYQKEQTKLPDFSHNLKICMFPPTNHTDRHHQLNNKQKTHHSPPDKNIRPAKLFQQKPDP